MNTEKESEQPKRRPQDPLTADKAAWRRYWQTAEDKERASDEDTRQLIEEGKTKAKRDNKRAQPKV